MTRCRWEMLKRIGDYAAGELSSEESHHVERLVREDTERQRLAEAYARMLPLLRAIGAESPTLPQMHTKQIILRAAEEACTGPQGEDRGRVYEIDERQVNE
jgi:anti-sigma-K factor RskA